MTNFDETRLFDSNFYDKNDIHNILKNVVATIKQRGYDPINQLMGYIKTADPIYIPRDNHAREQIRLIEMDDILEFLIVNEMLNDECMIVVEELKEVEFKPFKELDLIKKNDYGITALNVFKFMAG